MPEIFKPVQEWINKINNVLNIIKIIRGGILDQDLNDVKFLILFLN